MTYIYFLCFSYITHDGGTGVGNTDITLGAPITAIGQIRHIERLIVETIGYASVMLSQFPYLLRTEAE
jgi:hypothetical protein